MANSINTNISAYYAQTNIAKASNAATTSVSRLSSGNFITKASDDVARLSIGTSFSTTVRTLKQALVNASQGVSLLQVADGALGQITEILQRQKTLAVQASSGNLSNTDRSFLNQEFQALTQQIDFIASTSSFNGVKLLDGTLSTSSRLSDATKQATAGTASIGFSSNLSDGDAITINGLVFTAKNSPTTDQQFQIGATASDTARNLATKLTALTTSNAATITDTTTTYAQKLGANTYTVETGGTTLTIAARSGGSVSNKFTIDASSITSGAVSVSGAYGSSTVDLLASNVSAFTNATTDVAVSSSQSATAPFKVGDTLSIKIDDSAAINLYTFQAGDSLTDIVNGINASSSSTGVGATLIGDGTSGYNIRLNLSRSTGNNVSINGGDNFFKVAASGLQTTTLSGATSTTTLLSSSLAAAIGSTSATVVAGSAGATTPFVTNSHIYASVNGGARVDISGALGATDGLDDIVAKINASQGAGSLGIVASLSGTNIQIKYADSERTGAISFFTGSSSTVSTTFNTDALGQNQTNGLGGSFVSFNLLATGVSSPDTDIDGTASTAQHPIISGDDITVSINTTATAAPTAFTYTVGAGTTLQELAAQINSDPTTLAYGMHAAVVRDDGGNYNIKMSYASSALPTVGTGGSAIVGYGINIDYDTSGIADTNTNGTLNNVSTAVTDGVQGSEVSNTTTYRMFTTAFAQALPQGSASVVAATTGTASTPFVNNDVITLRYNNGAGAASLQISGTLATGQSLSDIVASINARAVSNSTGITAELDGNGNILLHNDGTVITSSTASTGTNEQVYINGGSAFYAGGTGVTSGLNNSYSTVNLFTGNVTSNAGSIANTASSANEPLDSDNNLQITVSGHLIDINVAVGETFATLAAKINADLVARQYGVHAVTTGSSAVGNITLYMEDYTATNSTTGAVPTLTIANTSANALLNTANTGLTFNAVDNVLQKASTYANTTSTTVGVTSNNVLGLTGGADNGLGVGSTTVSGSVSDTLLTSLAQKAAQVTIGFPDTDASALSDAFSGKTITVAGATFTFAASASSPTEITIGSSLQETIDNAVSAINKYGTDTAIGDTAYQLNQLVVSRNGNNLVFTGKGIGNVTKLDGTALTDIATTVANVSGPTNSGDLNNATRTGTGTFGVDVSGVSNADFTGKISGFTAEYVSSNTVNLTVKVGGNTYTALNVNTKPTVGATGSDSLGNEIVRFYSDSYEDENGKTINGGYFDVQLAVNQGDTVSNSTEAAAFGVRFNSAFQGLNFNQTRVISSYQGTDSIINASGTTIGSLVGSSVSAQLPTFEGNKLTNITVQAPSAGSVDAEISLVIDGTTYVSRGLGSSLGANQTYKLTSVSNPNNFVNFTTGDTAIDLSTAENATALKSALYTAFGASEGSSALSFQIGTSSAESLGVSIGAASTDSLFNGVTLSIATLEDASTASDAIDEALATVTSIRASVGALQSRFNFASANIQISVQNQDASRSELLDTDIAAESTSYATAQVQLQAGISVLAQANQQLQALLKLLG